MGFNVDVAVFVGADVWLTTGMWYPLACWVGLVMLPSVTGCPTVAAISLKRTKLFLHSRDAPWNHRAVVIA